MSLKAELRFHAPVRRLASLDGTDARLYDVTISRQGVFVLNAINNPTASKSSPTALTN